MADASRSDLAHLFRRLGFGARAEELDAAEAAGWDATLAGLLRPTGTDAGVGATPPPDVPLVQAAGAAGSAERTAANRTRSAQATALAQWWLARMVAVRDPFPEKLALFWHGHFATSIRKVREAAYMLSQNEIFRGQGQGSFPALTLAVGQNPAMMIWLDTDKDTAANPNENYARELMELFTLGVGSYTELDVRAGAKAFTGWSFDTATGAFREVAKRHDNSTKTFLGRTGDLDGTDVVNIVTGLPDAARFVTFRLWNRFGAPAAVTDPTVARLTPAAPFVVGPLLERMFADPAFLAAKGTLVAQPIEYVVGVCRQLALDPAKVRLLPALQGLGQVPFAPPNVGGWPAGSAWLTTAAAQTRLVFAQECAREADLSPVADVPAAQRISAVQRLLSLPDGFGPQTSTALRLAGGDPAALVATALVSPEYVVR